MLLYYIISALCVMFTVSGCPQHCTCDDHVITVDCTGVGLVTIPQDLPGSVLELKLAENSITNIDANAFSNTPGLTNLYLGHNLIQNISSGAFSSATELLEIDLSFNKLTTLDTDVFPLDKLVRLNLTGNSLRELPTGILVNCHQLNHLFLAQNQLTASVFDIVNQEVPWLRNLDLSHNALDAVPYLALKKMALLQFLNLKESMLKEIDSNSLVGLQSLEYLDLSGNSIPRLSREMFQPLERVAGIDISGNDVICECSVKELQDWLKETRVRMLTAAECEVPGTGETLDIENGDLDFLCTDSDNEVVGSSTTIFTPKTEPSDIVVEDAGVNPIILGLSVSLLVVFLVAVFLVIFLLCKRRKPKPKYASVRKKPPKESPRVPIKVTKSNFMEHGDPYEEIVDHGHPHTRSELDLRRLTIDSPSHSRSVPNLSRIEFVPSAPLPAIPHEAQDNKVRRFTKPTGKANTAPRRGQRPPWLTEDAEKGIRGTQLEPEPPPLRGSSSNLLHNGGSEHLVSDIDTAVTNTDQEALNPYEEIHDSAL